MEAVAVSVSILALLVSAATAIRQLSLAKHTNSVPILVDLFREHRSNYLAEARQTVYQKLPDMDLTKGLAGLPKPTRESVRDLMWFYDNLGVLVVHRIVDIRPVSGYLGGAALLVWESVEPLVQAERAKRKDASEARDPGRWQHYFELLVEEIRRNPPAKSRRVLHLGRFGR